MRLGEGIAPNEALSENIFVMLVCFFNKIPLMVRYHHHYITIRHPPLPLPSLYHHHHIITSHHYSITAAQHHPIITASQHHSITPSHHHHRITTVLTTHKGGRETRQLQD